MPKNIVLFLDGTNNQVSTDQTNVLRSYRITKESPEQITFYDCGVGTMPEPWNTGQFSKRWSLVKGLTTGSGLMENIEEGYRFLMDKYEADDRIFLFGFSRGAFTARAIAAMIHSVGLLKPGAHNLVRYAQDYWQKDLGPTSPGGLVCNDFKNTFGRACTIHFIGVWDTVSSVGYINEFRTFPYTFKNPSVRIVRHAVAIDERRCCFRQNLMRESDATQNIKNVWFAGVHSDVGGGYPEQEAGLAKIPFQWMIQEAIGAGLSVDQVKFATELNKKGVPPSPLADQHESLKGGWKLVEYVPVKRYNWATEKKEWRLPRGRSRDPVRDSKRRDVFLHESVIQRIKQLSTYRPPNLEHDETALRHQFQIEPYQYFSLSHRYSEA